MSIVLDANPWENIAIAITQADNKDMRALPRAVDGQLGKDSADLQRPTQVLSTMPVCPVEAGMAIMQSRGGSL